MSWRNRRSVFNSWHLLAALLALLNCTRSHANSVLFYLPFSSPSHKKVFTPLAEELADRGHNVTMITSVRHKEETPLNYQEIHVDVPNISEEIAKEVMRTRGGAKYMHEYVLSLLLTIGRRSAETQKATLEHPTVRHLIKIGQEEGDGPLFDLCVVSTIANDAGYYLARKLWNCPLILLQPAVGVGTLTAALGYFDNPSFVTSPYHLYPQTTSPSLLERTLSFVGHNFYGSLRRYFLAGSHEQVLREFEFTDDEHKATLDLVTLEREASFAMYFSHPLFDAVRPTLPNSIDIGGIHCREAKSLPPSLEGFFGSHPQGVVYISFGSWLSTDLVLPVDQKDIFWRFADAVPQGVVIKVSGPVPSHKSRLNVVAQDWLPQQDVLAKNNTVLFISQGGMMSVQESLFHGVPMVIIPVFGDQGANAHRSVRQGFARMIDPKELNLASLVFNVRAVISDPSYRHRAEQMGQLLRDAESPPRMRAAFWAEYVMRHRGAQHLRSPAHEVSFIQFFHVDVLVSLTAFGLLVPLLLLLCCCRRRKAKLD